MGPIRHLRRDSKSKVLFCEMSIRNLDNLVTKITDATREIAKSSSPAIDLTNPIATCEFYLALIYVFDPLPITMVLQIAENLQGSKNVNVVKTVAQTVINILFNEHKITCSSGVLSVAPNGINALIYTNRTKKNINKILTILTELRVKALNLTLRKKFYKKWVG